MLNGNSAPRIEQVQEQSSKPPSKRPTVQSLHAASLDLYDVALRAREVNQFILALPNLDSGLYTRIRVFDLVVRQAIAKTEGAL